MKEHKHKWQLIDAMAEDPEDLNTITEMGFVCICGRVKIVERREGL